MELNLEKLDGMFSAPHDKYSNAQMGSVAYQPVIDDRQNGDDYQFPPNTVSASCETMDLT